MLIPRLLVAAGVILGVMCLVFFLLHLVPGDPVDVMLGESAQPTDKEALRQAMGLHQPIHVQLVQYLNNVFHLDLGRSLYSGRPISELLLERLP
ncbi:MAG: ABC transporter permease, partial [Nitrospirota bacterium]|nr:ABC transporter permease [Nitrospirota bacterium]